MKHRTPDDSPTRTLRDTDGGPFPRGDRKFHTAQKAGLCGEGAVVGVQGEGVLEGDVVREDVEVGRVDVLGQVEGRARAAVGELEHGVFEEVLEDAALCFVPDGELGQVEARRVLVEREIEPDEALAERLERSGRAVDAVVGRVGRVRQAERLPLGENLGAQRAGGRFGGVRRADDLFAERRPREVARVEGDDEEPQRGLVLDEFLSQIRVKPVDDEHVRRCARRAVVISPGGIVVVIARIVARIVAAASL
mmetsp:Transcript_23918/g.94903  ORF Transcript_23918/g.94903 Transcript_23918/m.94903 type:complete len:251 (+) Transcript_23918:82-834(+)